MRSWDVHLVNNNEPHPCFLVSTDSKGDNCSESLLYASVDSGRLRGGQDFARKKRQAGNGIDREKYTIGLLP